MVIVSLQSNKTLIKKLVPGTAVCCDGPDHVCLEDCRLWKFLLEKQLNALSKS